MINLWNSSWAIKSKVFIQSHIIRQIAGHYQMWNHVDMRIYIHILWPTRRRKRRTREQRKEASVKLLEEDWTKETFLFILWENHFFLKSYFWRHVLDRVVLVHMKMMMMFRILCWVSSPSSPRREMDSHKPWREFCIKSPSWSVQTIAYMDSSKVTEMDRRTGTGERKTKLKINWQTSSFWGTHTRSERERLVIQNWSSLDRTHGLLLSIYMDHFIHYSLDNHNYTLLYAPGWCADMRRRIWVGCWWTKCRKWDVGHSTRRIVYIEVDEV